MTLICYLIPTCPHIQADLGGFRKGPVINYGEGGGLQNERGGGGECSFTLKGERKKLAEGKGRKTF